ncbi:MAG TPA: response regulator [Bacteroidales bacterium]|nr:response regulator [Bacteroidales bacterium]
MMNETGRINDTDILKRSLIENFDTNKRNAERLAIVALLCLIAAVILISLGLEFPAGLLVIVAASAGILMYRNSARLLNNLRNSLDEFFSVKEKQNEVIRNFSHKIREPLNNMVIITDMLMKSGLTVRQKELLETFIASTNNMVTTLNELSMHSAGHLSFEHRKAIKFNLVSSIENTFDLYNLKDQANLEFIFNKKEIGDAEYYGDPIIIKQIFLDIFNIIEDHASEDKAVIVTINLKKINETPAESTICFRIQTDRNIVLIGENDAGKSLAANLINSGRGSYEQEFGPNHTILNICMPFVNPVPEPKQKPGSAIMEELAPKEKVHKDIKDLKVLLVEDNLINQKITLLTLSPFVGSIDTASNGKEALDKFGTSNYDLILMDIQMPVMSGLTAAEKIRALESSTNSHVPIIAITANAMIGDKEKCLAVGIDDYISKPFQPSSLVDKIKKII